MRQLLVVMATLVVAAGCTDSPVTPAEPHGPGPAGALASGQTTQGCLDGYVCGGTEITWGPNGPWLGGGDGTPLPPDDEGQCMASYAGIDGGQTVQGCQTGDENDPTATDAISPLDTVPNCAVAQTRPWARAYCRSTMPNAAREAAIRAALTRMEQRGEQCAQLAARGRELLNSGRLRTFAPVDGDHGGWGNPNIGVILAEYWIDQYASTASPDNRNLDHTLAHELDHTFGRMHTDFTGYETANSRACSGLSGTSP